MSHRPTVALLTCLVLGQATALTRTAFTITRRAISCKPVQRGTPTFLLLAKIGSNVPDVPFAASYKSSEIAALWNALKQCYGAEDLARQAVAQNNQVLCPLYASPELLKQTFAALVKIMGSKDAAREVMLLNPAVLTCGARELASSEASEILQAAKTRQVLDRFVNPAGAAVFVLAVLFLNAIYRVAMINLS